MGTAGAVALWDSVRSTGVVDNGTEATALTDFVEERDVAGVIFLRLGVGAAPCVLIEVGTAAATSTECFRGTDNPRTASGFAFCASFLCRSSFALALNSRNWNAIPAGVDSPKSWAITIDTENHVSIKS